MYIYISFVFNFYIHLCCMYPIWIFFGTGDNHACAGNQAQIDKLEYSPALPVRIVKGVHLHGYLYHLINIVAKLCTSTL